MAIGLDVASNGSSTTTSPLTWNHTCTGVNLVLVVGIVVVSTSGTPDCSTVTYNGVSLTLIGNKITVSSTVQVSLWYLLSPLTGTHTISVGFTGTSADCNGGAVSWTGVSQSGQPDANNGGITGFFDQPSITVTTIADNCWVIGVLGNSSNRAITANLTSRWTGLSGTATCGLEDTNAPKTPAGNQAVGWTVTTDGYSAIQAASFAPAMTSLKDIIQPGIIAFPR